MKHITVKIEELSPGKCAVDMAVLEGGSRIENEMAKAISLGVKTAMLFMAKAGKSATILEGADIEQFVAAAMERAKR